MEQPQTPPPPPYAWLHAGYFHRRREYRVVRQRGTDDWLLFFTLGGCGRFRHDRGETLARPGTLTLYAPRTLQDYGLADDHGGWEFLWFHFHARPEWAELLKWPEVAPGLGELAANERPLRRRIEQALREAHRVTSFGHRHAKVRAMHALERCFLLCAGGLPGDGDRPLDARIERALAYIQRHLRTPLTREKLARHVGLSTHRFAHLFQEQLGKSPRQFIEEERLKLARHLLETSAAPMGEIAEEAGFTSLFYFSQRFKAVIGHAPTTFRRRARRQVGTSDQVD